MLFIGDVSNKDLSEGIAKKLGLKVEYPDIHIFPDSERRVRIIPPVVSEKVIVLKSTYNPVDSSLIEFCFIVDALKRNGAKSIYGIVPYLPYCRADHMFRPGEGVPLEIVIKLMESVGLNRILFIDPHSIKTPEMFHIPTDNISAISIFAQKIKDLKVGNGDLTLVSPDNGGIRRIKLLAEELGRNIEVAVIDKERNLDTGELDVMSIKGKINKICFVMDDMISTGGTIAKAVNVLSQKGAKEVYIFATHPVFVKNAPEILQNSKATKVFVTDSIPVPEEKRFEKLEVLSLAKVIADKIRTINE